MRAAEGPQEPTKAPGGPQIPAQPLPPPTGPPEAPGRPSLAERLAALEAKHDRGNPIADEEARRLGEPPEPASDDTLTLDQAEANVRLSLPVESASRYHRTPDGWLNTDTGEITATLPTG